MKALLLVLIVTGPALAQAPPPPPAPDWHNVPMVDVEDYLRRPDYYM